MYYHKEKKLYFSFSILEHRYVYDVLLFFMHQMMVQFHPSHFITNLYDEDTNHILYHMQFIPDGNSLTYAVDSMRYLVRDNAFTDRELIVHQGLFTDVPFGRYSTKDKGCGWIAAYNLLHINHRYESLQSIIHGLDENAILHEFLGENICHLYHFLEDRGLDCALKFGLRKSLLRQLDGYQSGILLYSHDRGAHYVTFERVDAERFHFYNGIYGKRNHIDTMKHYLSQYSILPFHFMILVK